MRKRRVHRFKLSADNEIVLGDGTKIQTKGNKGDKGDRGTDGNDGEEGQMGSPGSAGSQGPVGAMGPPGIDGENEESNDLSGRMGAHGSFTDDDHKQYQLRSEEDVASGYAGLNTSSRTTKGTDTTDDVIVDDATKGLILKDIQDPPHYWRVTISILGAIVTADLGHEKP